MAHRTVQRGLPDRHGDRRDRIRGGGPHDLHGQLRDSGRLWAWLCRSIRERESILPPIKPFSTKAMAHRSRISATSDQFALYPCSRLTRTLFQWSSLDLTCSSPAWVSAISSTAYWKCRA